MAEDKKERLDRELSELVDEIRVALPGVQVLFAFLLTIAFTSPFESVTDAERVVYFVAFLSAALASVFLIAPMTFHRLRWRKYDKEAMLRISNRLAIVGTGFLALSMGAVIFLVSDVVYGEAVAGVASAVIAAVLAWFWYGLPLMRRLADHRLDAAGGFESDGVTVAAKDGSRQAEALPTSRR